MAQDVEIVEKRIQQARHEEVLIAESTVGSQFYLPRREREEQINHEMDKMKYSVIIS